MSEDYRIKKAKKDVHRYESTSLANDDVCSLLGVVSELQSINSDMYEALNCMIAGASAVACPNAGERQVLQEAVDIAQKAIKKAKGE